MTTVRAVLAAKGGEVHSVTPQTTVYDALKKLAEHSIGALAVLEGGKLVGIVSERDYARKVILKGKSSLDTPVRDIMSTRVVCVGPLLTVEEGMGLMTAHSVRHLPILEGTSLVGIVSIGDLVKSVIQDKEFVIEQLEHYIRGEFR